MTVRINRCELCDTQGGHLLWRDEQLRVVWVDDPDYPGYCRVIWNHHVAEMTDLTPADQRHCMQAVFAVERALRSTLDAAKVNLASLGNMTPHVHWHVVARFPDDRHFPASIWSEPLREAGPACASPDLTALAHAIGEAVSQAQAGA